MVNRTLQTLLPASGIILNWAEGSAYYSERKHGLALRSTWLGRKDSTYAAI